MVIKDKLINKCLHLLSVSLHNMEHYLLTHKAVVDSNMKAGIMQVLVCDHCYDNPSFLRATLVSEYCIYSDS